MQSAVDDGSHAEPREPHQESRPPEAPREQRNEGTQAPLDLPPPPAAKPFVVWSSSPGSGGPDRRDD
jgi:hypothetical protein